MCVCVRVCVHMVECTCMCVCKYVCLLTRDFSIATAEARLMTKKDHWIYATSLLHQCWCYSVCVFVWICVYICLCVHVYIRAVVRVYDKFLLRSFHTFHPHVHYPAFINIHFY